MAMASDFIPHNRVIFMAEDRAAVDAVLASGQVGQGPKVAEFEEALTEKFGGGKRRAIIVSSGTAALFLALKAYGVHAGDWVAVPTYSCTALVHAVRLTGASVTLLDAGQYLEPVYSGNPYSACIHVHIYGVPTECPSLLGHKVVIEDGAQALGAGLNGKPVGLGGDISVFSLGPTKPLTAGAGGFILANPDIAEHIREMRDYDQKDASRFRFNFQMSDLHAALGLSRLGRFNADWEWRKDVSRRYRAAGPSGVFIHDAGAPSNSNRYRFILMFETSRAAARAGLDFAVSGIETIVPLRPDELLHRHLGFDPRRFPNAERAAETTLSLPIWPGMSNAQVERVCEVLSRIKP